MLKFALFLLVMAAISLILWILEITSLPSGYALMNAALALAALGLVLLLARLFLRR